MPTRLLLRFFEADPDQVEWLVMDHGSIVHGLQRSHLADIAVPEGDYQSIVLVPTSQILLTQATVPKTSPAKLRQAVPYAMEEDLAEDVTQLHFVLGDWQAERLAVAVVRKSCMETWLTSLNEHHLAVDIMLPDLAALPYADSVWTVAIEQSLTLIRTGFHEGMAFDTANLETTLHLLLNDTRDNRPERLTCLNYASAFNPDRLNKLPLAADIVTRPEPLLISAAKLIPDQPILNLLQGAFKPKRKAKQWPRQWYIVVGLAVTWLVIVMGGELAQYFYFSWQHNRLTQQIAATYRQVSPSTAGMDNPRLSLTRKLKQLLQAATGSPFQRLLAQAGEPLHNNSAIKLEQLNYQGDQLKLTVTASSFLALQDLQQRLQNRGLKVSQTNVTSQGKTVSAQIAISTD